MASIFDTEAISKQIELAESNPPKHYISQVSEGGAHTYVLSRYFLGRIDILLAKEFNGREADFLTEVSNLRAYFNAETITDEDIYGNVMYAINPKNPSKTSNT